MASLTASTRDGIKIEPKARPISPKMSFPCPPAIPQVGWPDRDLETGSLSASKRGGGKVEGKVWPVKGHPANLSFPPGNPPPIPQVGCPTGDLERASLKASRMGGIKFLPKSSKMPLPCPT